MSIPKSHKILIPEASKKADVSTELMEDVIDFFYKKLSEKLTDCTVTAIAVPGFGSFRMNLSSIKDAIHNLEVYLNRDDVKEFDTRVSDNIRLENLRKAEIEITQLYERKKNNKPLEKPNPYIRRD